MNILERYFAPARGAIREFVGISTFFKPADLGLYERLLPAPFGVPDQPLVTVAAIDYLKAAPWPLTRWQEWGVYLRCTWRGQSGLYPVSAPVTRWLPMSAGRYLGYPKYVADRISVTHKGAAWSADASHRGVRQLGLRFQPDASHVAEPWAMDLLADEAFFKGDVYVVVPPETGTSPRRVSFSYVEQQWTSLVGKVHVEIDSKASWGPLVPGCGPFPGQASHFSGGLNLVATKLDSAASIRPDLVKRLARDPSRDRCRSRGQDRDSIWSETV